MEMTSREPTAPREPDDESPMRADPTVGAQLQEMISAILRLSLEKVGLGEMLERMLARILCVPWLAGRAGAGIFLIDPETRKLSMQVGVDLPEPLELPEPDSADGDRWPCCVPIGFGDRELGLLHVHVRSGGEIRDDQERFLGIVADVLAVTIDRRRAEESLRRSEERFELAIQGSEAGIWDWDLSTNAVYFSPLWKSQLGHEDHEIGSDFREWETRLHADDRERAFRVVRDYLDGRTAEFELEHRLAHKDGSYRWILARGAMIRDHEGRPYRMVGSHLDITHRKRVEAQLRAGHARLLAARGILERLMPGSPLERPGLFIHGVSIAADYAQGDCYDYFAHPDGSILAMVADVSGHGIDAALLMAGLHARIRSYAEMGLGLGEILERANAALAQQTESDRFITLLILRIDADGRSLQYVNAGHPTGYVLGPGGELKHELVGTGIPLAISDEAGYPVGEPIPIDRGDRIVLVSDGVLEASSRDGTPFGVHGLLDVIRRELDRPGSAILSSLRDAMVRHTGSAVFDDDVTGLVVRFDGP